MKSCGTPTADGTHETPPLKRMWPVQTLTLLLCLTDEEQLFAQAVPPDPQPAAIEVESAQPDPAADALVLMIEAEA